jgi:hypothetical protein
MPPRAGVASTSARLETIPEEEEEVESSAPRLGLTLSRAYNVPDTRDGRRDIGTAVVFYERAVVKYLFSVSFIFCKMVSSSLGSHHAMRME